MQQRAGDFDAAHLSARQGAGLVLGAVGEARARQRRLSKAARVDRANAVQGCVVEEILHHAEFEIERARLKDDAKLAQRCAGLAHDVMAEDLDLAVARGIEPRDQREQRALARAVQSKQHREAAGRDGKADVVERLARAIGVADVSDRERVGHCGAPTGLSFPAFATRMTGNPEPRPTAPIAALDSRSRFARRE